MALEGRVEALRATAAPALLVVMSGEPFGDRCDGLEPEHRFCQVGRAAEIKVDIFPVIRHPFLHGRVQRVSQGATTRAKPEDKASTQSGAHGGTSGLRDQEFVYATRVSPDRTEMDIDGRKVALAVGVALIVETTTEERRVIEHLPPPLLRYRRASLRERLGDDKQR